MKGMRKIKRGTDFRGVLNYAFGRDDDHKEAPGQLIGGNMSGNDPRSLAKEFGITAGLRPDIKKPVWHNSLRLREGEHLTDNQWSLIAGAYMEKMGFSPMHPRCYVFHNDKEGEHVHILASRIGFDSQVYFGRNENLESTRHIQSLEKEFNLMLTKGPECAGGKIKMPDVKPITDKNEIEAAIRTGIKPPRIVLQEMLNEAIKVAKYASKFVEVLEHRGVIVLPNISTTGRLNGFSFCLDRVVFKGSSLGNKYKWSNLRRTIDYVEDRDSKKLSDVQRTARNFINDIDRNAGNASGVEAVARNDSRDDNEVVRTIGPDGGGFRQGAGYPESDHFASDLRSYGDDSGADQQFGTGQSTKDGANGSRSKSPSSRIEQASGSLEERNEKTPDSENGARRTDLKTYIAVLVDSGICVDIDRSFGADTDNFGKVSLMSWNTRFKQASVRKHGKSQNERQDVDRKSEFKRLCETAHMADLITYMRDLGMDVKKDGVKDYVVEDQYRIPRKQDGHFVWCSWDQSRGGDTLSFCTEEQGLSFQQALGELAGGRLTPAAPRFMPNCERYPSSPPFSRNSDAVFTYLEDRGISQSTVRSAQGAGFLRFVDYQDVPAAAFCGLDGVGRLRLMTIRLIKSVLSWDGEKAITKLDVMHSNKAFPAILRSPVPSAVSPDLWIVEGGTDALAVMDWYRSDRVAVPTVIVSGGAGVRAFLDQPHVQTLLKQSAKVYLALENEKNPGTQIKTDVAHQRQSDKILELGCEVVAWRPPFGSKDIADAWKSRILPDAHDPLAHMRQENKSPDVTMLQPTPNSRLASMSTL